MKTLSLLLSMTTFAGFAQHSINWEPEITVADGNAYGNLRARIALDGSNTPLVLMGKVGGGELFVARGNGASFNTPIQVTPSGMQTYIANWTGPDIAADGNTVVVVFKEKDYTLGKIYAVRSTDGGITFGDTLRVDNHDAGVTWMPALDMDDNGNPHVTYMVFNAAGADERIAVASSADGGVSYGPQQIVTGISPGVACDCCPPEIVTKGQYQLALFRNNETNVRDTWAALSENNGSSFTSTANMDELGWSITSCPATGPHAVISGDSAYVVSTSAASGAYRVYVSSVGLNGGLDVSAVNMMAPPLTGNSEAQNYPRISGSSDTLVAVWEEREGGNTNIMAAVTIDGLAQTLVSYKSMVNANAAGAQLKPDVIFRDGYVHAIYHDLTSADIIYRRGTIVDVTGLNEFGGDKLLVSPVPNNGRMYLSGVNLNEISEISVVNGLGQSVQAQVIENEITIPSRGVYLVKVVLNTGGVLQQKVIVQ